MTAPQPQDGSDLSGRVAGSEPTGAPGVTASSAADAPLSATATDGLAHELSSTLAAIYQHAIDQYPNECCGYVLRTPDGLEVVPCINRQDRLHELDPVANPRTAREGYNIGGGELLRLVRSFESPAPAIVIYHSHPEVGAYFSAEDTQAATSAGYPVDYLVVDVRKDGVHGSVLFRAPTAGPLGQPEEPGEYLEIARFAAAP